MNETSLVLDITHLNDQSFWEAVEIFQGPIWASHSNCRALVPGDRQLTDEMIRHIVERDGVIGSALDAWMLVPDWIQGVTTPEVFSMEDYVDHIDHVCQIAGNANHAAIGTDLDGGYGTEQTPRDLDTIDDLQSIPDRLRARGYSRSRHREDHARQLAAHARTGLDRRGDRSCRKLLVTSSIDPALSSMATSNGILAKAVDNVQKHDVKFMDAAQVFRRSRPHRTGLAAWR